MSVPAFHEESQRDGDTMVKVTKKKRKDKTRKRERERERNRKIKKQDIYTTRKLLMYYCNRRYLKIPPSPK